MADYTYNISDFVNLGSPLSIGNVSLLGLEQQTNASSISSAQLSYVSINESNIIFTFDNTLSGSPDDVSILDSIVANHDGSFVPEATGDTILPFSFSDTDGTPLKTLNYVHTRSATIVFEGTDFYESAPVKVEISCYTEGDTVGCARIYDLNNDVVIAQNSSINNTTEQIISLEIIDDWPEDQTTLELQMKRVSGDPLVNHFIISSMQIIF